MVRYCSVNGCLENTRRNKNRRFFRFPSDEKRCRQWVKMIKRDDLNIKDVKTLHSSYFVCELHFSVSACPKRYLRADALPAFYLPQLENLGGVSNISTQTDFSLLCGSCKSAMSAQEIPNSSESVPSAQSPKMLPSTIIKVEIELKEEKEDSDDYS